MKKRAVQALGCLLVMTMMAGKLDSMWGKDGDRNRDKNRSKGRQKEQ